MYACRQAMQRVEKSTITEGEKVISEIGKNFPYLNII